MALPAYSLLHSSDMMTLPSQPHGQCQTLLCLQTVGTCKAIIMTASVPTRLVKLRCSLALQAISLKDPVAYQMHCEAVISAAKPTLYCCACRQPLDGWLQPDLWSGQRLHPRILFSDHVFPGLGSGVCPIHSGDVHLLLLQLCHGNPTYPGRAQEHPFQGSGTHWLW